MANPVLPERQRAQRVRMISPLPPPEEVFFDWLLAVPPHADLEVEARRQIDLIDLRAPRHPGARRLRVLLTGIAGAGDWTGGAVQP